MSLKNNNNELLYGINIGFVLIIFWNTKESVSGQDDGIDTGNYEFVFSLAEVFGHEAIL